MKKEIVSKSFGLIILEDIKFPTVITSNDLKVLGIDSLIQEATKSAGK